MDSQKKPPEIGQILPPGHGLTPSMKATQCWALLKYLPLVIGDKVPEGDKHYQLLLQLSELVDVAFSTRFTPGMVTYMKGLISDHLTMFVELYGKQVAVKPKHHFLVHLPTIVLKSGPLVGMSCLKYELKNSFFKRSSHIVCNFINICKTLANRRQHFAMYSCMSNLHQRDVVVVGKSSCIPVFSVLQGTATVELCNILDIASTDNVIVARRLSRASIDYRTDHHFVIDFDNDEPVFGKVKCFVCSTGQQQWHILMQKTRTVMFVSHLHSYMIEDCSPNSYCVVSLTDLTDHHAVCCYEKSLGTKTAKFVRMPYYVW